MKKILKPIITDDMKKIYDFFEKNSDVLSVIPISASKLCELLDYTKKDISHIVKSINSIPSFKNVILGSNDGYYFITKNNKNIGYKVLLDRSDKVCAELEYIQALRAKITFI